MPGWPHSGFGAHVGAPIAAEDRESVLRVARYGARAPVAESRRRYHAGRAEVERVSDHSAGPDAGVHRFAALEFLARRVDQFPGRGCGRAGGARAELLRRAFAVEVERCARCGGKTRNAAFRDRARS